MWGVRTRRLCRIPLPGPLTDRPKAEQQPAAKLGLHQRAALLHRALPQIAARDSMGRRANSAGSVRQPRLSERFRELVWDSLADDCVRENQEMERVLYDRIGQSYSGTRQTDPRLAELIWEALGNAETVLNVGAGSGAYEPRDRSVCAVEPSAVMIAQRPASAVRAVQASAEALPFADSSFDVVMAVLSDHHWRDRRQGLQELRRVARGRVVLFNANPAEADSFWLTAEYLPGFLDLIPARDPGCWCLAERAGGIVGAAQVGCCADPARLRRRVLRRVLAPPGRLS